MKATRAVPRTVLPLDGAANVVFSRGRRDETDRSGREQALAASDDREAA